MENGFSGSNISSAEYWFSKGKLNHFANPLLKKFREEAILTNIISPENAICLLFGFAYQSAGEYNKHKESHFNTINSFFFTKKRRLNEAEHLNDLGKADQILFDTHNYFKQNTDFLSKQYDEGIEAVLDEIDNGSNPVYREIKFAIDDAKKQIIELRRDFLNMYLGYNATYETDEFLNSFLFIYNTKREGIIDLKRTADIGVSGKKLFPHASAFLQTHIIEPASKSPVLIAMKSPNYARLLFELQNEDNMYF